MKLTYAEHIGPLLDSDKQSPVSEQNIGVLYFSSKKEKVPLKFLKNKEFKHLSSQFSRMAYATIFLPFFNTGNFESIVYGQDITIKSIYWKPFYN